MFDRLPRALLPSGILLRHLLGEAASRLSAFQDAAESKLGYKLPKEHRTCISTLQREVDITTNQDAVLREVVVTLKEENAFLKRWLEDKSLSEDVMRGMEISLTKLSVALGKVLELGIPSEGKS